MKKFLISQLINIWKVLKCYAMSKKTTDIEEQLRRAILTSGISRYRLSQLTGVANAVLSNFVNGHRSLTLTTAAKLAKALGLSLKPDKKKGKVKHG